MEPTIDDRIHMVVADRVVVEKGLQRHLAYLSPDRANWSDFQLTVHHACESAYDTFSLLEDAWTLSEKTDQALSDQALAAYAAWQAIERIARPYFPDL